MASKIRQITQQRGSNYYPDMINNKTDEAIQSTSGAASILGFQRDNCCMSSSPAAWYITPALFLKTVIPIPTSSPPVPYTMD